MPRILLDAILGFTDEHAMHEPLSASISLSTLVNAARNGDAEDLEFAIAAITPKLKRDSGRVVDPRCHRPAVVYLQIELLLRYEGHLGRLRG